MDLTTLTTTPSTTPDDTDNDTPSHIHPSKPLSFSNGILKKHHYHRHLQSPFGVVAYRECLKNHAASLGGHALDGCGEFMPSPTVNPSDPTSLKCAACGCHRNFHRRESDDYSQPIGLTPHFLYFHQPRRSSSSPSPPPPQSQPSAAFSYEPEMLLALSSAAHENQQGLSNHHQVALPVTPTAVKAENLSGRKRFRTKFTQEQKEKMHSFSEKLGWKMQKCDDSLVKEFCNEIGVARGVLKVWMHNNKSTLGKRETIISNNNNGTSPNNDDNNTSRDRVSFNNEYNINGSSNNDENNNYSTVNLRVSTNGSSPSSS